MISRLRDAWRNIILYAWDHPWARQSRVRTFARIVRWQIRSALDGGPHTVAWIGDSKLVIRRGMRGATGYHYYGLHEFADMALVGHFLREGEVFGDVGANAGVYTVFAAKVCGARVHAVEPAPETLGALMQNVAANSIADHVEVHPVALSDCRGAVAFSSGRDATNRITDASVEGAQQVIAMRADDLFAGKGLVAIKVDVEGAEDAVFAGAGALLAEPQLRVLLIETVSSALRAQLLREGFVEAFYDPFSRTFCDSQIANGANNRLFLRDIPFVELRVRSGRTMSYRGLTV